MGPAMDYTAVSISHAICSGVSSVDYLSVIGNSKLDVKILGRWRFLEHLLYQWEHRYGQSEAQKVLCRFGLNLDKFVEYGISAFSSQLAPREFGEFVIRYDQFMLSTGSSQLLHTFADLLDSSTLLTDPVIRKLLFSPILRVFIEWELGGAALAVDARSKDTAPISVHGRENVFHIDNNPFITECKILLTWSAHSEAGPNGQCFEAFCGRRELADEFNQPDPHIAVFENDLNICNKKNLENVLSSMFRTSDDNILRFKSSAWPIVTVFIASSVPHRRARSVSEPSRSSVCISFQADGAGNSGIGSFMQADDYLHLFKVAKNESNILREESLGDFLLTRDETVDMVKLYGQAESVEQKKRSFFASRLMGRDTGSGLSANNVAVLMSYDMSSNLNLLLYPDERDQIRKMCRKHLREMPNSERILRLQKWEVFLQDVRPTDVISVETLRVLAKQIIDLCSQLRDFPIDSTTRKSYHSSITAFTGDLREGIGRCSCRQELITTSLMLFWVADEAWERGISGHPIFGIAKSLLRHYVALNLELFENM